MYLGGIKKLKDQGHHVIEKWECGWDKDVKTDPELQQFLVDFEIVDPLQPQGAFFVDHKSRYSQLLRNG